MGPIVPMIEVGDVGVLCWVQQYSQEGWVPTVSGLSTATNGNGTTTTTTTTLTGSNTAALQQRRRRRIRLETRGSVRFQITNILHDGYGGGNYQRSARTSIASSPSLPFILVEAKLYLDEMTTAQTPSSSSSSLSLLDKGRRKGTRGDHTLQEVMSLLQQVTERLGPEICFTATQCIELAESTAKALGMDASRLQAEIASFALASVVSRESSTRERLHLLRNKDLKERIRVLKKLMGYSH